MKLKCKKGRTIKIVSAMYGRRKKGVCKGPNDQNTNCKGSGKTLKKVRKRCNGKRNCKIPAKNSEFGDPCGGTYKYLEVKFTCRKGTFVADFRVQTCPMEHIKVEKIKVILIEFNQNP